MASVPAGVELTVALDGRPVARCIQLVAGRETPRATSPSRRMMRQAFINLLEVMVAGVYGFLCASRRQRRIGVTAPSWPPVPIGVGSPWDARTVLPQYWARALRPDRRTPPNTSRSDSEFATQPVRAVHAAGKPPGHRKKA